VENNYVKCTPPRSRIVDVAQRKQCSPDKVFIRFTQQKNKVVTSATLPASMVTIRSESKIVCSRWAMVKQVESLNLLRMDCCTMASVSRSMLAVASSMARTLGARSTARAKQMSCRWPVDQLLPPSSTRAFKPPGCCSSMLGPSSAAQLPQQKKRKKNGRELSIREVRASGNVSNMDQRHGKKSSYE